MRRGVLIQIFFYVTTFRQNAPPHSPTTLQSNHVIPIPIHRERNLLPILGYYPWLTKSNLITISIVIIVYKDQDDPEIPIAIWMDFNASGILTYISIYF
jgi:hypothetical protein